MSFIFFTPKLTSGYEITLSKDSLVSSLRDLATASAPTGSLSEGTYKIVYSGKKLEDGMSLSEAGIPDNATVYLMSCSTTRRRSNTKRKCSAARCNSQPLRMVGDCQYCSGKFCSKHRLLENHNCIGLQRCKEQYHERNALKLESEQTAASKV